MSYDFDANIPQNHICLVLKISIKYWNFSACFCLFACWHYSLFFNFFCILLHTFSSASYFSSLNFIDLFVCLFVFWFLLFGTEHFSISATLAWGERLACLNQRNFEMSKNIGNNTVHFIILVSPSRYTRAKSCLIDHWALN